MRFGSKDGGRDREGIVEERIRDGFDQDTFIYVYKILKADVFYRH